MSAYNQGHYDDGYGHQGQGEYYQDGQGYYDQNEYSQHGEYYDRSYVTFSITRLWVIC